MVNDFAVNPLNVTVPVPPARLTVPPATFVAAAKFAPPLLLIVNPARPVTPPTAPTTPNVPVPVAIVRDWLPFKVLAMLIAALVVDKVVPVASVTAFA